jgi:hypothetical protein
MIAKPKPTGNKVVDQWQLELWEAKKAQQDAIDAYNEYVAKWSKPNPFAGYGGVERQELLDKIHATTAKVNIVYDLLPYSDPDHRRISGALKSIKHLDVTLAAKCINRYLENRPKTLITKYEERLDRYEWNVECINVYQDKDNEVTEQNFLGKIWVEQPADGTMVAGKMIKLTLGYGMGDGETKIINGYLLADVHRKCAYACADLVDNIAKAEAEAEAEAKEAEAAGKSIFTKKNRDEAKEYWREIAHNNDDQEIVRLWNKGLTATRIAEEIDRSDSHVENRIIILREEYPKYVLTNKARKLFNFRDKS